MRSLKDMTSFGLIKREGTKVFITDIPKTPKPQNPKTQNPKS
jgi:hypothetical protein